MKFIFFHSGKFTKFFNLSSINLIFWLSTDLIFLRNTYIIFRITTFIVSSVRPGVILDIRFHSKQLHWSASGIAALRQPR